LQHSLILRFSLSRTGSVLAVACLLLLSGACPARAQTSSTLINFDSQGRQVIRLDTAGAPVDAHDGNIGYFDGMYYLYGTSYICGYTWGKAGSPFCGFKVYASPDLVAWTDRGFLFDPHTAQWQSRCNGSTYGCYRPHVVYNSKSNLYVLWINVYDNRVGYRVFTSPNPAGPFVETAEPMLAFNTNASVAGLNNGDEDVFADQDGAAYIAYTNWRAGGSVVVEKLNAAFTSGSGQYASVTDKKTEAPALMHRNGLYYLLYSDPNCGYCAGTGTSYRTAPSPLGPWSQARSASPDSCGGQPSFVSTLRLPANTVFLYGSDLWDHGAKNEAHANYYWAPLSFASDGAIHPIQCQARVSFPPAPAP